MKAVFETTEFDNSAHVAAQKRLLGAVCTLTLLLLLWPAFPVFAADSLRLTITGSSTVAPVVAEIAKRYEATHPGTRIDVQAGGSSRGVSDVRQGVSQIGMVSRDLNPSETDLKAFPIARDGICLIVNRVNPIQKLDDAQVVDIYLGRIKNWSALGGKNSPIVVVSKAEGRSTLELFMHYFKLKAPEIKPDVIIGENQQAIKVVAGNPNAIGYVSIGAAEYEALHGAAIKLLPVNGKEPSVAAVATADFPITRPLNLVTKGRQSQIVTDFIAFARSAKVNDLIRAQYFVPFAAK